MKKRKYLSLFLILTILIITTGVLADTATITLDGNQITALAQTIKLLSGCPHSNYYHFYGSSDTATKDKI